MRGGGLPPAVALCGLGGEEVSAFLAALLPLLSEKGLSVAVVRSSRRLSGTARAGAYLDAGAAGVAAYDRGRSMVLRAGAVTETHLLAQFSDADLVLLEGFAQSFWPKLELLSPGERTPRCDPSTLLAVLGDQPLSLPGVASLPPSPQAAADFLVGYLDTGRSQPPVFSPPSPPPRRPSLSAARLPVDDRCYVGEREDAAAQAVRTLLEEAGCPVGASLLLPNDYSMVTAALRQLCGEDRADLILLLDPAGFSPWACTQAAVRDVGRRELPGIPQAIRALDFPGAPLYAGEAGICQRALLLSLPGQPGACRVILRAYLPTLLRAAKGLRAP